MRASTCSFSSRGKSNGTFVLIELDLRLAQLERVGGHRRDDDHGDIRHLLFARIDAACFGSPSNSRDPLAARRDRRQLVGAQRDDVRPLHEVVDAERGEEARAAGGRAARDSSRPCSRPPATGENGPQKIGAAVLRPLGDRRGSAC